MICGSKITPLGASKKLLKALRRLSEAGNTVLVIEHNLDVIAASDWLIELGPEGGDAGGRLIYSGPVAEVINVRGSHTGFYLKEHMARKETSGARDKAIAGTPH